MAGSVLAIGASGNVGAPLVEALVARGERVKAASRSGRATAGAEGVPFDFADRASFGPALDGADRAFVMMPTGFSNAHEQLIPVIEAAAAGRTKVVLMSVLGADADDAIPYRRAEIALERSGTPFVILRPNWFADNFHTFWKPGIDHGRIAVPAGDGRSSFIDARDIAASAAAALTDGRFDGRAFDLTGPAALGYADAARVLSAVVGRTIAYEAIDDATFVGILTGAGVPEDYARFLAAIFHPVREGWTAQVTGDVETLTGQPPRTLETYAQDHAAQLV